MADRRYIASRPLGAHGQGKARQSGRRGIRIVDPATGQAVELTNYAQPVIYSTGAQSVPANGSVTVNVRFDTRLPALITSLRGFEATAGAIAVNVVDQRLGRSWMSRDCLLSLISGDGQQPYVPPVPVLALPDAQGVGAVYRVTLTNSTGAPVVAHFAFESLELQRPGLAQPVARAFEREQLFFYSVPLAIAGGAGTGLGQAQIFLQSDGDFELHDLNASPATNFDLRWQSTGTRMFFSNVRLAAESIVGDGQFPGTFMTPQLYQRGDTILFDALNRQVAAQNVELVAAGVKVLS